MLVQNQQGAVKIPRSPRDINKPTMYRLFGERQIRYASGGACLKC